MKKLTKTIITATIIGTMNLTALATEFPIESVPPHVTINQIAITENLISPILYEVENGSGYGEANGKAHQLPLLSVTNLIKSPSLTSVSSFE